MVLGAGMLGGGDVTGDRLVDRHGRTVGLVAGDDEVARENARKILAATGGRLVPAATRADWLAQERAH